MGNLDEKEDDRDEMIEVTRMLYSEGLLDDVVNKKRILAVITRGLRGVRVRTRNQPRGVCL